MLKNILNFILLFFVILIIGMFLNKVLDGAVSKETSMHCVQLNQYDKELDHFYVTEQEEKDCKEVGITLTAQVKTAEQLKKEYGIK